MISKSFAIFGTLTLLSAVADTGSGAQAQTAPMALRGKSVIVAWVEDRSLREVGETSFRDVRNTFSKNIYISTEGRPFQRLTVTAGAHAASGEGSVGATGDNYQVHFQGHSLEMTGGLSSGARRIVVTFNDNHTSCEARVVTAKPAGAELLRIKSLVSGRLFEIRSTSVSGTTCTMREGNVFAQ